MKIAILGFGREGRAAYDYWNSPENQITVCDASIMDVPAGVGTNFESDYLNNLHEYDLVVRSPIIRPSDIRDNNTDHPEVMERVTSGTNEFFRVCPSKNIIGITGSKGKGTTSTLIAKFLAATGHRVHLGGNIGTAALELLKNDIKPEDWVILELSSFQLVDIQHSPGVAVCLMITPEHLDWHGDMYEYIKAKQQMFAHQLPENTVVFNARNVYSEEIADVSRANRIPYDVPPEHEGPETTTGAYVKGLHIYYRGKKVCDVEDVALLGWHNLENVCAAIAATWDVMVATTQKPQEIIKKVVRAFAGLPHRIEIVKQVNGVWFINDSFASNPGATQAAIKAVEHPQILIIGGYDRGLDLSELVDTIRSSERIKKVIIIGSTAERIVSAFRAVGFENFMVSKATDMQSIVAEAFALARKNDAVILSPAFPSFDMFKNFEDRGNQFKAAVQAL